MIHLNKLDNKNIYTFSIEGDIDEKSAKEFYALLEAKALQNEKMKLLGSIREFPSFKDLKAFTATFEIKRKALHNIEKYALLTDKHWIEAFVPISNFLTPDIPVKKFSLLQLEEAIEWLEKDEVESPTFEVKKIEGTNIYQFTIDGKIDETGMSGLYQVLKTHSKNSKISLMAIVKDFDGFDHVKTLIHGLKVDFAAIGKINKYAIVTDETWIKKMEKIGDFLTPGMPMKVFSLHDKNNAVAWLKES